MFQLTKDRLSFPDPAHYSPPEGLLAVGGDLSAERLLLAYQNGIFPWFNEGDEILWWSPDPRFVLFPDRLRISKSMKKVLKSEIFSFTENQCFREVMLQCKSAKRAGQDGTWISNEMIEAYEQLHHLGFAKSVEVWQSGELVGGFYGITAGRVFCGESMFAKVSNASKAGFINFVLNSKMHYDIIDCQVYTEHLESLGAEMIPKLSYLSYL